MAELQAVSGQVGVPAVQGPLGVLGGRRQNIPSLRPHSHTALQRNQSLALSLEQWRGSGQGQVLQATCPLDQLASGPPWGTKVGSVPAPVTLSWEHFDGASQGLLAHKGRSAIPAGKWVQTPVAPVAFGIQYKPLRMPLRHPMVPPLPSPRLCPPHFPSSSSHTSLCAVPLSC